MSSNSWVTTPNVLTDTSTGITSTRIVDEMFRDREVQCMGDIDEDLTNSLCLQLRYLQRSDPKAPITMLINSPGGQLMSGLAILDVMRAGTCPIRTVCLGMAASMAAILFMAGSQRDMLPHSQVLVHDPLVDGGVGGSALTVKALSDNLLRMRSMMAKVIAECCGKSVEEVLRVTAHDTFFEAADAVAWGIADRVIERL